MRFPHRFERTAEQIGTDPAPDGVEYATRDNVLVSRQFNASGWPVQRVSFAWYAESPAPVGSPPRLLDVVAYVLDHESGRWFVASSISGVPEQTLVHLDHPAMIDAPHAQRMIQGPDPIEVAVLVRGKVPPGRYVFVMGPDTSSAP